MTVIAAALKHMLAAGMDHDAIVAAVADMEAQKPVDAQAERRRAADRERKRLRNSAESAERAEDPRPLKKAPQTPKEITPTPVHTHEDGPAREPRQFDRFWVEYPNRVGKRKAEDAFAKALKRASFDAIMAGLKRYCAKTDDREWCNPATWLNQDRWEDEPAAPLLRQPHQRSSSPPPPPHNGQPRTVAEAASLKLLELKAQNDERARQNCGRLDASDRDAEARSTQGSGGFTLPPFRLGVVGR